VKAVHAETVQAEPADLSQDSKAAACPSNIVGKQREPFDFPFHVPLSPKRNQINASRGSEGQRSMSRLVDGTYFFALPGINAHSGRFSAVYRGVVLIVRSASSGTIRCGAAHWRRTFSLNPDYSEQEGSLKNRAFSCWLRPQHAWLAELRQVKASRLFSTVFN